MIMVLFCVAGVFVAAAQSPATVVISVIIIIRVMDIILLSLSHLTKK